MDESELLKYDNIYEYMKSEKFTIIDLITFNIDLDRKELLDLNRNFTNRIRHWSKSKPYKK